jgi:hypothetical protein
LVRYCRGIDRGDPELMMSAFHDDALDDHGIICGEASAFVTWAIDGHNAGQYRTQHFLGTFSCDIEGDVANAETYWHFASYNKPPLAAVSLMGGRYLDRLERRNGRWAIAHRICVYDWHGPHGAFFPQEIMESFNSASRPTRDRADPSHKRPYTVDPKRIGYLWKAEG